MFEGCSISYVYLLIVLFKDQARISLIISIIVFYPSLNMPSSATGCDLDKDNWTSVIRIHFFSPFFLFSPFLLYSLSLCLFHLPLVFVSHFSFSFSPFIPFPSLYLFLSLPFPTFFFTGLSLPPSTSFYIFFLFS